jgi:arylsulfatase A-like enzyme
MNKKSKILLMFLIFVGLICFLTLVRHLKKTPRPNIILITLDALRADHLKCYGYIKETSPFISEFAKDAFLFERAIAQSASTVPSVASMLTSQYPYTNCLVTASYHFRESQITIAEFLKNKGYETYAVVGNMHVSRAFGFNRGFNYFDDNFIKIRNADELTSSAIQLLKARKNIKNFFLWLHYREPHSPYHPPIKYEEMFFKKELSHERNKLDVYTLQGKKSYLSKAKVSELGNLYDANIRFVDDNLRELFEYLKQGGLLSNSIIIITADHGESLGEHNIFDHNELYYGILRVPLIIKIPKIKGVCNRYPVVLLDIFPTILELLGYKKDPILKTLQGKSVFCKRGPQEELFSEYSDRHSLIIDNFRLFLNAKGEYRLYDINKDPLEFDNLVLVKKKEFNFLKDKMNIFLKPSQCKYIDIEPILDERTKTNLKSLGYVQ